MAAARDDDLSIAPEYMMLRVVFRCDGGPSIGSGHVMRCLALSSAFAAGGWQIGFAVSAETVASVTALAGSGHEVLVLEGPAAEEPAALSRRWADGVHILVVDHYGRDAAFEQACRPWARRVLVIDDLADRPHDAEVVMDPGSAAASYERLVSADCTILAGPRYAIVHPRFAALREEALARRDGRPVERVLVSFGQIDPPNATIHALEALNLANFSGDVDVVLGRAAPHLEAVRAAAGDRVHLHVDANDMPALMTAADLAMGAGGGTAWERCCLGLPTILVEIAENQRSVIASVAGAGAGVYAGAHGGDLTRRLGEGLRELLQDVAARQVMAVAGANLVDGRGAWRILLAAVGGKTTREGAAVTLRPAEADDENWLLELQREPETRRYANDPAPPTAEGHRRWFASTLPDPARKLTIVEHEGRRAGMMRLDSGPEAVRVSIAIHPTFHRLGIGAAALALAARTVPGRVLEAEVLSENEGSQALFLAAGYRQVSASLCRRKPE